jgi:acyl carrier protein
MRRAVSTALPGSLSRDDIAERVVATIAWQLGVDELALAFDTSIARDLLGDSLYAVEAIMALEEEFNLRISDEDAATITTVGRAIEHITCALGSQGAGQSQAAARPYASCNR